MYLSIRMNLKMTWIKTKNLFFTIPYTHEYNHNHNMLSNVLLFSVNLRLFVKLTISSHSYYTDIFSREIEKKIEKFVYNSIDINTYVLCIWIISICVYCVRIEYKQHTAKKRTFLLFIMIQKEDRENHLSYFY